MAYLLSGSPYSPVKEPRSWIVISSAGVGRPEPIADLNKQLLGHVLSARDLMAAITENRQPLCNMQEGRTIMEMVAAVFESQRQNGQRVTFPLQMRDNPLARL